MDPVVLGFSLPRQAPQQLPMTMGAKLTQIGHLRSDLTAHQGGSSSTSANSRASVRSLLTDQHPNPATADVLHAPWQVATAVLAGGLALRASDRRWHRRWRAVQTTRQNHRWKSRIVLMAAENDDVDAPGNNDSTAEEAEALNIANYLRNSSKRWVQWLPTLGFLGRSSGASRPPLAPMWRVVLLPILLLSLLGTSFWALSKDPALLPLFNNVVAASGHVWGLLREGFGRFWQFAGFDKQSKGRDLLILLSSTAFGLPFLQKLGVRSKALGFLGIGMLIGPSGLSLISDVPWSEHLAEIGIIFFLCEMGLELSFERLQNMRRDVFGLGVAQFGLTSLVLFMVSRFFLGFSAVQSLVLGTAFSLSSSAFVLQLLDEAKERGTSHGRSAFGVLLLQDLAVPFLLAMLPMLSAGSTREALLAMRGAAINAGVSLSLLMLGGRKFLAQAFGFVAASGSAAALRALSFLTVLGMCFIFDLCHLSNTLGAFLAGVLLGETPYREQVDAAISPIREDLLGLFFMTVGFGIDLRFVLRSPGLVAGCVVALLAVKALVAMLVCLAYGIRFANAQQIGLLLCQAGEFAFVIFGIAREAGVFADEQSKFLLTVTSLSMACTPFLAKLGSFISGRLQSQIDDQLTLRPVNWTQELATKVEHARVLVCGYGTVGSLITELLDTKFIPWVAFDINARVVTEARAKDLPVFFGDLPSLTSRAVGGRDQELLGSNKVAVITTSSESLAIYMVQRLRRAYPNLTVVARAKSASSAATIKKLGAVPIMPEMIQDSKLTNLPVGLSVLRALDIPQEDAETLVDKIRRSYRKEAQDEEAADKDDVASKEGP